MMLFDETKCITIDNKGTSKTPFGDQIARYPLKNHYVWENTNNHCLGEDFIVNEYANLKFIKLYMMSDCCEKEGNALSEICTICQCTLHVAFEESRLENSELEIAELVQCNDKFHLSCIQKCIKDPLNPYFRCPNCQRIYGCLFGDQPIDGKMSVTSFEKGTLPLCSFEDVGTILIEYYFPDGYLYKDQDFNEKVYYSGTYRRAFLPDNHDGWEVLHLLIIAFKRRLTFTIGTSVTTGLDNTVVWNGIHHKTNISGGSQCFGYPDKTYFLRVKEELAAKGITITSI